MSCMAHDIQGGISIVQPSIVHIVEQVHTYKNVNSNPDDQTKERTPDFQCRMGAKCHIAVDMPVDLLQLPQWVHGDPLVGSRNILFEEPNGCMPIMGNDFSEGCAEVLEAIQSCNK